jgi:hypothetical protein
MVALIWFSLFSLSYVYLKWRFGPIFLDDAYTTLSHAKTWVETGTPLFTHHNPVNCTSTPLYTMIMAAAGLLFGAGNPAMEFYAYFVNSLCDIIMLIIVYKISRSIGISSTASLLAVSATGLSLNFLVLSASGMETMVYGAIVLLGIWGAMKTKSDRVTTLLPAFLAPVIRPEGFILSAVIILTCYLKKRSIRSIVSPVVVTFTGLLVFISFYYFSYGYLLPHSIIAKKIQVHYGFFQALESWISQSFFKGPVIGGESLMIIFNLFIIIAAIAGLIKTKTTITAGKLLLWPYAYILFFFLTYSSDPACSWYYLPPLPVIIIALTFGIFQLLRKKENLLRLLLFMFVPVVVAGTLHESLPEKFRQVYEDREQRYKKIMTFMNTIATGSQTILYSDIGVMGLYGKQTILDYCGLASPKVVPYWTSSTGQNDRYNLLISTFAPDWLFTRRNYHDPVVDTIILGKRPQYHYTRIQDFPGSKNSDIIIVWKKQPF